MQNVATYRVCDDILSFCVSLVSSYVSESRVLSSLYSFSISEQITRDVLHTGREAVELAKSITWSPSVSSGVERTASALCPGAPCGLRACKNRAHSVSWQR